MLVMSHLMKSCGSAGCDAERDLSAAAALPDGACAEALADCYNDCAGTPKAIGSTASLSKSHPRRKQISRGNILMTSVASSSLIGAEGTYSLFHSLYLAIVLSGKLTGISTLSAIFFFAFGFHSVKTYMLRLGDCCCKKENVQCCSCTFAGTCPTLHCLQVEHVL
jgi:hypothetical protein